MMKIGFTKKEIMKSIGYLAIYLTGKNMLISGTLGITLGLVITWKYKMFKSVILSLFMIIILYLLTRISLRLSMKKLLKEIEEKHITKKKKRTLSFNTLTPLSISVKYLLYNFKRTLSIVIIYMISAILLNFSFSVGNSIDIDRYILNGWGKANYKLILEDDENPEIPTHKLQIDNPLDKKLEKNVLKIKGIDRLEKIEYLDMKVKGDEEDLDISLFNINEELSGKVEVGDLKKNEVILSVNESVKDEIDKRISDGKILGTIYDGNSRKKASFNIKKVFIDNVTYATVYTSEETIKSIVETSPVSVYNIYGKESKDTEREIKKLIKGKTISLESKEDYSKDLKLGINMLLVGMYIVMIVIIMFSITVVLNMKFMNIVTRKNDFISFNKLGVDNSEVKKMLLIEDSIYGIPIVIIAFFTGNYLSSNFCRYMDKIGGGYMFFQMSFLGIVANILLFVTLSFLGIKSYKLLFSNDENIEKN